MGSRWRTILVGIGLSLLGAGASQAIDVFVRSPRNTASLFGKVKVEVEVLSDSPVAEVEFRFEGKLVRRLDLPPWSLVIDVGDENRERRIEVIAHNLAGESASREIVLPALAVEDELDLDLQQLYVTVTRGGETVLDLTQETFEVRDDGEPQKIVTFERGDVPLTAVVLLDTSASMQGELLQAALAGARAFLEDLHPLDQAKVPLFSDELLSSTPFSNDPEIVGAVVTPAVEAGGGTAIDDQLYVALEQLEGRQGRRLVILLSDGIDNESALGIDDVAWKAGRTQAIVYWIRLGEGSDQERHSQWRDAEGYRHEIEGLHEVVASTGGRIRDLANVHDAAAAFGEILAELRAQYVFGYYPTGDRNDGAWHEVEVRAKGAGVKVRTLKGYIDAED